ncbi:MAG: hypothetical protein AAF653_18115, partial [Chloroflexota bacterium]
VEQAAQLETQLLLAVHLTDGAAIQLEALAQQLEQIDVPVCGIAIFRDGEKSTGSEWVNLAAEKLTGFEVGAGTDAFFTELNRGRPAEDDRDFLIFSTNPQVHAFEVVDLVETLTAHAPLIETAQTFNHGKPIIVSPVTLKMRFNPNATGPEPDTPAGELPPQVDVRQMSLFGAGWTLGALKYLSEPVVPRITFYETTGWRGVIETEHAAHVHGDIFPTRAGIAFPMYHVFADVAEFAGGELVKIASSDPLTVDGLMLEKDGRRRVMLANYTDKTQQIRIPGLDGDLVVKSLDEWCAEAAMTDPETYRKSAGDHMHSDEDDIAITLRPFAIVRIDG